MLRYHVKSSQIIKEIVYSKTKNYCWPMIYEDAAQLEQNLKQSQYKYIVIMSSYGLNGWILAKEWEIQVKKREEQAE